MTVEERIASALDAGDYAGATTLTLRTYGAEIMRLLGAMHRDEDVAGDAFSEFAEELWRTLPRFERRCSMRTWAYLLARRTSHRIARSARRRHHVGLAADSEVGVLVAQVRTTTLTHLRGEAVDQLAALRRELDEEDQLLLVLRVDRSLEWRELAQVFLDDAAADAESLTREAARLRKRFQLAKAKLLKLGRERGVFRRSG